MDDKKTCKSCGEEISKKAKVCPHWSKKQSKFPAWLRVLIGVLVIIIGIAAIASGAQEEKEKEQEKFSHEVTNEYTDSIGAHYIEGTVKNSNDKEYSYVQIEFVCYDKDGNNVGTALANTNNLGSNESWKFKAMLMSTSGEADHCDFKEITSW